MPCIRQYSLRLHKDPEAETGPGLNRRILGDGSFGFPESEPETEQTFSSAGVLLGICAVIEGSFGTLKFSAEIAKIGLPRIFSFILFSGLK